MHASAHFLVLLLMATCASAAEPVARNPVVIFRDLLAMRTDAREKDLAVRPEHLRTVLTSRLRAYDALPPAEREARLRATELRYHLHPLLTVPRSERAIKAAAVPENFRPLVEQRLAAWDKLPGEIQREVLGNEPLVQAITRPAVANAFPPLPPGLEPKVPDNVAHWQSLGPLEREQLLNSFTHYFRLDEQAKNRVVAALPAPSRAETARTLGQLEQLSPAERTACLVALRKLGQMMPAEQARFYANAELWQKMSDLERAAWRTVVTQFPPLPPGADAQPPLPPGLN